VMDAKANSEVQTLLEDYGRLKQYRDEVYGVMKARDGYWGSRSCPDIPEVKPCSTPGRTAASIRSKYTNAWLSLLRIYLFGWGDVQIPRSVERTPYPLDEKLIKKLRKELVKEVEYYEKRLEWMKEHREKTQKLLTRAKEMLGYLDENPALGLFADIDKSPHHPHQRDPHIKQSVLTVSVRYDGKWYDIYLEEEYHNRWYLVVRYGALPKDTTYRGTNEGGIELYKQALEMIVDLAKDTYRPNPFDDGEVIVEMRANRERKRLAEEFARVRS